MMKRFDDAWQEALALAGEVIAEGVDVVVVRDLLGRAAVVIADTADRPYPQESRTRIGGRLAARCAPFVADRPVLAATDLFAPESIISAPSVQILSDRDETTGRGSLAVLDQGLTGAGWRTVADAASSAPTVVTLYGFKGGVGRSTATAVLARHLAELGRCVLAVDLDWESPGMSAIALRNEDMPDYGIVDYLIESGVDNADGLDCVSRSSGLRVHTNGEVWVAPAGGRPRSGYSYIPKLNRAYLGYPQDGERTFTGRLRAAVDYCTAEVERRSRRPDVILLDSRSGIHDLAAVAITQLSDLALLFAVDNSQSWAGYEGLFGQWRSAAIADHMRDRLRMVAAMVPSARTDEYLNGFRDRAQSLFAESLYDEVAADQADDVDAYSPPLTDTEAPHSPLPILFTGDLVGADLSRDTEWLDQDFVGAAFDGFVRGAADLILGPGGGES